MNVIVEELASSQPVVDRTITLGNPSLEMLLFDFLQDLIYYKDAKTLLLHVRIIRIEHQDHHYALQAQGSGERLKPERHHTCADVKAVTLT